MKKYILMMLALLSILSLCSDNSFFDWRYLKDGRFTIYYPKGKYLYAKYTMNTLKKYAKSVDDITGNQRKQSLNIVLEDTGELHNGMANPVENKLKLFLNTPNTHGSFNSQEWLNTLVIHEYTHYSHLTQASKTPLHLSKICGNIFSPNLYSPMWIVEGITVRNESHFSPYMGRLNNGYYTEIINAQLRDGKFQNHIKANYYLDDYPLGNYYVYGGAFMEWLSYMYGEEKLTEFFKYYGSDFKNIVIGSILPKYTLDKAAKHVFDKSFPELFKQWKSYLEMSADFEKEINSQTILHDWDDTILVSNLTSDNISNLFFFETKKYFNHYRKNIIKYDVNTEKSEIIYRSNSSLSANMEIFDNNLYFAEEEVEFTGNNLSFRGYSGTSVLKKLDLDDYNSSSVIFKKKFKDFTVSETGVIYYTCEDSETMTSSLYKFTNNHHSLVENFSFLISEIIYHDNTIYCTYKYPNSSWDIGTIALSENEFSPLITTKSQEKNIHINNNILLFTSNQNNKSQAYSYDLNKRNISKCSNNFYADMPNILNNRLYFRNIAGTGERVSVADIITLPADLDLVDDSGLITILDDDYDENIAFDESLQQLFVPYVRLPFGVLSSDGIGYFDFSADWYYDSDRGGIIEGNISTQLFSPLYLSFNVNNDHGSNLYAQLPIYNSQVNWLNSIDLSAQYNFNDSAYLGNSILLRKFNTTLHNRYLYDIQENGFNNKTVITYNFKKLQLSSFYERILDFHKSPVFTENSTDSEESTYNDYGIVADFNLFKIRNGLWTPNVAMKDLDLSLGVYQNNYNSNDYDWYYKFSAVSQLYAATALQFELESGLYFNENKIKPFIRFGTEF